MAQLIPREDGSVERRTEGLPPPTRMTLPAHLRDAGLSGFAGAVRFRRRFGLPRRIDDFERVWLTCAGVSGSSAWWLNGELLDRLGPDVSTTEIEVTRRLLARNELTVEVEAPSDMGGLWGEVALEVRCRAYLRGVRVSSERMDECYRLRVCGEVVGENDGPLEIYILSDGRTIGYRPCHAGEQFEVVTDELPVTTEPTLTVRVDLVNGATIWYVTEQTVARPGV